MHTYTIHTLIATISTSLHHYYHDRNLARTYAWWLVSHITQKTQTELLCAEHITLSDEQQAWIDEAIQKQIDEQMPIQYIIGWVPFAHLHIKVQPPLLIPRPDTESWVVDLIQLLQPVAANPLQILDIGTGTGCIALALAHALPHAMVYAVDISAQAIAGARENAHVNHITNIRLLQSDLYQQLPTDLRFDIIVSNPPYIAASQWHQLEPTVKQWEDYHALVADQEGYALLQKIITHAPSYLTHNQLVSAHHIPQLVLEVGYQQADHVAHMLAQEGYHQITIMHDLQGHNRAVRARYYR